MLTHELPAYGEDSPLRCSPGCALLEALVPREFHFALQFLLEAGVDLKAPVVLWSLSGQGYPVMSG